MSRQHNHYAVEVKDLVVAYDHMPVVWDVSFSLSPGSLLGIIGPNGAGKSSMIHAMVSLIKERKGTVRFYGKPFSTAYKNVAYVSQRSSVDWNFPITAFEVVLMGAYVKKKWLFSPSKEQKSKAHEILDKLKILEYAHKEIQDLSGGQAQRLFVARALMQEADIYIFDEPFVGIDKTTEEIIMQTLKELKTMGKTVIVVHHDLNTAALYFDHILLMNRRLIAFGKTEDTLTKENLVTAYEQNCAIFETVLERSIKMQEGQI